MSTPLTGTFRLRAGTEAVQSASAGGALFLRNFNTNEDVPPASQPATSQEAVRSSLDGFSLIGRGAGWDDSPFEQGAAVFDTQWSPDHSAIDLNPGTGNAETLDFFELPAGFTVTSLTVRINAISSGGTKEILHDGFVVDTIDPDNSSSPTDFLVTPTPSFLASFNGNFGVRLSIDAGSSGAPAQVHLAEVIGTYEIDNISAGNFSERRNADDATEGGIEEIEDLPAELTLEVETLDAGAGSNPSILENWERIDRTFDVNPVTGDRFTVADLVDQRFGARITLNDADEVHIDRIAITVEYLLMTWWLAEANGWYTRRVSDPSLGAETLVAPTFNPLYPKPIPFDAPYPTLPAYMAVSGFKGIIFVPLEWLEAPFPPIETDHGWYFSTAAFGGDIVVVANGRPKNARSFNKLLPFAAGNAAMLGGSPGVACVYNNHLVYADDDYISYPTIRIFDGRFDRELCQIPPTASSAIPKSVVSLLVANGKVYISTLDTGADSTDWVGRVFELTVETGELAPVGAAFAAGHVPYALAWHQGRLWCGTHRKSPAASGKLYSFRPGIDTTWTEEHDLSTNSVGGVCSLLSFQGDLYIGTDAPAATFAKLLKRASLDGAYSTVRTGSVGTAKNNNGFLALAEFDDKLYASYWNDDDGLDDPVSLIEEYDPDEAAWTTVYTGAVHTAKPFIVFGVDLGVLIAFAGGLHRAGAIVRTENGTDWIDLTAELPENDKTLTPAFGVLVL